MSKKTDDILNVWFPPLPNNDKVKVTILPGSSATYYFDHYRTLNIEPFIEYNGNKHYLVAMFVNEEFVISTPKLYLDEHINDVVLYYYDLKNNLLGVVESIDNVSFTNYLPQFGIGLEYVSFPRASNYKGIKFGQETLEADIYAFPVDLDKEDFEIWLNGIKLTLHLNRDNKVDKYGTVVSLFDVIKAEFYGILLIAEEIDDYVELKPKGV